MHLITLLTVGFFVDVTPFLGYNRVQGKEDDMTKLYTYINDSKVKEILQLVNSLNECLKYPNSENSLDERRYSEHFEAKILEVIKRKKVK
ncbi:hypothetical protein UFOVP242_212 [uncultured Caudovirales phage]|uniref:Uncharacterized protein n=1 Tax=uncultured Caudovirales phage TaxID=2100421 RepID=A0A6J7WYR2_9CAUD|nr:hypothetical protein UFOVP242_212 [uncultured Caudovirales phage]